MKKVFQIFTHVMPWEIDNCLVLFDTFARAKRSTTETYKFDIALNVSNYHIDWSQSKLDREYFVEKMDYYSRLLSDFDEVNVKIYDGDENYGHLDLQKEVVKPENDYYVAITPDQMFDASMLNLFEHSVKLIKEKYFVLVAEIPKFWDASWDTISSEFYKDLPYTNGSFDYYEKINRYEALNIIADNPVKLQKLSEIKFAGWFDVYSKAFYEELVPVPNEWKGYGQWDLFSMLVLINLKKLDYHIDFSQYKLTNAITTSIEYSNWNKGENRLIYKNRLSLKSIPSQREYYDRNMPRYVDEQLNRIISNRIGI